MADEKITPTTAAELPEGSIVADGRWVVQAEGGDYWRWHATDGHTYSNGQVDEALGKSAAVLRYGR